MCHVSCMMYEYDDICAYVYVCIHHSNLMLFYDIFNTPTHTPYTHNQLPHTHTHCDRRNKFAIVVKCHSNSHYVRVHVNMCVHVCMCVCTGVCVRVYVCVYDVPIWTIIACYLSFQSSVMRALNH